MGSNHMLSIDHKKTNDMPDVAYITAEASNMIHTVPDLSITYTVQLLIYVIKVSPEILGHSEQWEKQ
jgi:hypothetical protein